jgi:hypothetical protein
MYMHVHLDFKQDVCSGVHTGLGWQNTQNVLWAQSPKNGVHMQQHRPFECSVPVIHTNYE